MYSLRVKRFRQLEMIAKRVIRKSKRIERGDGLLTRGSKTQLPWFRNRCVGHHYHNDCSSFSFVWKRRCFYICMFLYCVLLFFM